MKISKVINNNVVSSLDKQGKEFIAIGKGIGFQKHSGDIVDESQIEKYFSVVDLNTTKFAKLLKDIPYEHIQVSDEIIRYARTKLKETLNENIYITLTDHLNFAIERNQNGIAFQNALLWEIKRYYKMEFEVGLKALNIIKDRLDVDLPEDEAGSIALHLVNAQMEGDMHETMLAPTIIRDIVNIVKYTFRIDIEEDTLNYERFVTHLKFFIQRIANNQAYAEEDEDYINSVVRKFPEAHMCADRIAAYVSAKLKYEVPKEEILYLTLHIKRIVNVKPK